MRLRNIIALATVATYLVLNILFMTVVNYNRTMLVIGPYFVLILVAEYKKPTHGLIAVSILIATNIFLLHIPTLSLTISGSIFHIIGIPLAYIILTNKQMSHRLKKQTQKLIKSNKTKDRLFSILGHDLRNSVGGINQLIQVMLDYYDEYTDEQRLDFLETLQQAGSNTFNLLENLLLWVREQAGESVFQPCESSAAEITQDAVKQVVISAKTKEIIITNSITDDNPFVFDPRMIQTVIRNFLSNAIKFTPPGGTIEVNMTRTPEEVVFSITDTGVGISDEALPTLFNKEKEITSYGTSGEKGIGIGLKICHNFVKKHKGDIWIDTEIGKGTTFYFNIPILLPEKAVKK